MSEAMKTIPQIVAEAAGKWGSAAAIVEDGVEVSFTDLQAEARACASALIARGFPAGGRAAIWAPNVREWISAALGVMMAGGAIVPINTRFKGSEAADILRRAKTSFLFTVSGFLGTDYPSMIAGEDLPELQHTVLLRGEGGESYSDFLASGASAEGEVDARIAAITPETVSDIIFTSGTTGAPKGAMTMHGQNIRVVEAWCDAVGVREGDNYLIVNPFFHSFGYKAGWLACLLRGATALPHLVFDAEQILKRIEADKITVLPGPPTIFQSLLALPDLGAADISSLRTTITGAASVPVQLVKDMKNVLGFESVFTGYGLTEASGFVSLCVEGDDFETIANTAGRAIEGVEVKLVDGEGNKVGAGEAGEVLVRGFNVMLGYLDDAQATAETITEDGWLKTGDIGVMNEAGYLKITDRAKDMFITGGFNCYPAEIENILLGHEGVADVAVIGAPDERMGEVAHAFIVPNASKTLDADAIIAWSREHMANYKVPRKVSFVDELPRNASGKVQKFKLRDDAA